MIKRIFLLVWCCPICLLVFPFHIANAVDLRPIIVLVEYDHWGNPYGADSPIFALYEDGTVIYEKRDSNGLIDNFSVKLNEYEMYHLFDTLRFYERLIRLGDYYEGTYVTCQPTNVLFMWFIDGYKAVTVWGDLANLKRRDELNIRPDSLTVNSDHNDSLLLAEKGIPESFVYAFDVLATYYHSDAVSWTPAKIEVMIWPYEYSPEDPVPWPQGWPGIENSDTKKRGDSYSIFLEYTLRNELLALINGLGEKQAVELDGKKWAISYRIPFPGEGQLRKE